MKHILFDLAIATLAFPKVLEGVKRGMKEGSEWKRRMDEVGNEDVAKEDMVTTWQKCDIGDSIW